MSYQVLARKWRPKTFADMVGQTAVVRALGNALDQDRLHHAYLFTGTRGVGKTTLARILAKSLNCEQGVSSTPCGECRVCREVDEGRFVDLIEVDAASRTKVDQTRELLEQVPYAPVGGRYKVYLIDEVHMFSESSFNALLKTLEEPPGHVKFLLATTDPQKVPVTVLSRCLQFHLRRLSVEQIQAQFERILAAEEIAYEPAALQALARAADGSMRDGLSLLDQTIGFGGGRVQSADVDALLGTSGLAAVPELLFSVQRADGGGVLAQIAELAELSVDFATALQHLLLCLHRVALLQQLPEALDPAWEQGERLQALASTLLPADVQLYYQIALHGQRDLPWAPDLRSGFEMTLLRMLAFRPADPGEPPAPVTGTASGASSSLAGAGGEPGASHGAARNAPAEGGPARISGPADDLPPVGNAAVPRQQAAGLDRSPPAPAETAAPPLTSAPNPSPSALAPTPPVSVPAPQVPEQSPKLPEPAPQVAEQTPQVPEPAPQVPDPAPAAPDLATSAPDSAPPAGLSTPPASARPDDADPPPPATPTPAAEPVAAVAEPAPPPGQHGAGGAGRWESLLPQLGLKGMSAELARHCTVADWQDGQLTLTLDPSYASLQGRMAERGLRAALQRQFGEAFVLAVTVGTQAGDTPALRSAERQRQRHSELLDSLRADPLVRVLTEQAGAELLEQSVRPRGEPH